MGRWLIVGLVLATGCEPDVSRDYNTGANGTNPVGPAGNESTGATWDCDNVCEAVTTDDEVLCLVDAVESDGYNLFLYPDTCPSWLNTEFTDEDCITCASRLDLSDDDCRRYREACNIQ